MRSFVKLASYSHILSIYPSYSYSLSIYPSYSHSLSIYPSYSHSLSIYPSYSHSLSIYPPASQAVLVVKNPPTNTRKVRDTGLIPGSGRSPGEGHGNPVQYSFLENPMDRGAWRAMVSRAIKSRARLKRLSTAQYIYLTISIHLSIALYLSPPLLTAPSLSLSSRLSLLGLPCPSLTSI